MNRLIPGTPVSYYKTTPGYTTQGRWIKARVKKLSATRMTITIENPDVGEKPFRAVSMENVEFGWEKAEKFG